MKHLLQRMLKWLAYTAAAAVILLAVGVGLFRLLLPRLPEYQDDIKRWATAAIGLQVEFSGMDARWRFSGPELNFYDASLGLPGAAQDAFTADEVSVGIDLMRLLLDRTLVVDRLGVRASSVDVSRDANGAWFVQGIPADDLTSRFSGTPEEGRDIVFSAQEVTVRYLDERGGRAVNVGIDDFRLTREGASVDAEMIAELPPSLGSGVQVTAGKRAAVGNEPARWNVTIETRGLVLPGWARLQSASLPEPSAGAADLSLAMEWRGEQIANAVADFSIGGLQTADTSAVGADGRVVYERDSAGWLLVADQFRLSTDRGTWPETTVRLQVATDASERMRSFDGTASYLNMADLRPLLPWLPEKARDLFQSYAPSGVVHELNVGLADMQQAEPRYDIAMQLENAGLRATDHWPGLRGFSGTLRANRSGGRIEVDADDAVLDLSRWLAAPVPLTRAQGTIIWRHNSAATTVLSDSIVVENADFTSRSSLQISLPADGSTPIVDLESQWSVNDIGDARRYLPVNLIKPPLYKWLDSALLAGRVSHATTRLSGPLDRFPFDKGEGVFRIDATLEDAKLRYSDLWPDVENLDLELIVDRTRLYSAHNTAVNAGNNVVDAKIEIKDLRAPVLTIDASATGTMQTIRRFARESPINSVFGGHLTDVSVAGDASFSLQLRYPIFDRDGYEFTTRIRAHDGSIRVAGLAPPITELNGVVIISREDIAAEDLTGRFLDSPIDVELQQAGDARPGYSVVAEIRGDLTPGGVGRGFGVPVQGLASGAAPYVAQLLFPKAGADTPQPMQVEVASDTQGLEVLLPPPVHKAGSAKRPLSFKIVFPDATRIDTAGRYGEDIQWSLAFLKDGNGAWDFDRGMLAVGGADPGTADTRGLHIVGNTPDLSLHDWLNSASGEGIGVADRIRDINLEVNNLYVLGQHFGAHRLSVDRGANDWVVQLDGEQADGTVTIPYNLRGSRPLILDMERLTLPGSDENQPKSGISTDPRTMPPLSIRADDFAFGERHLGQLQAEFSKTADGLTATNIRATDESFTITGSASWAVDVSEPAGQRTRVAAVLHSTDVDETMQRLNSRPGIQGKDMDIRFDVSWSGGPREDFLQSLDGDFQVRLGTGQLDEVEPGAGRMFGLMSVVALPRRLALDFRDVLDKGFVFDEITGTFRVDDGNAYTCDLSLKGPAADIGIVGRAGLVQKDYDQSAIVSANVGNTLPMVGAVVAGPQVAAALLIFSQIFKKPLQEMGQVYYAIEGSWDQPDVDSANARRFAASSKLAGCLNDAG